MEQWFPFQKQTPSSQTKAWPLGPATPSQTQAGTTKYECVCACVRVRFRVIKSCLLFIRMFSTLKRRWRDVVVCLARPWRRRGAPHQTGSVLGLFFPLAWWWVVCSMLFHLWFCPRSCLGSVNYHCRQSCASCRCWFLRWRRSASTSGPKPHS